MMKYCDTCGCELKNNESSCPVCGSPTGCGGQTNAGTETNPVPEVPSDAGAKEQQDSGAGSVPEVQPGVSAEAKPVPGAQVRAGAGPEGKAGVNAKAPDRSAGDPGKEPEKKKMAPGLKAAIAGLLIAGLGVGGFFGIRALTDKGDKENASTEQTGQEASTDAANPGNLATAEGIINLTLSAETLKAISDPTQVTVTASSVGWETVTAHPDKTGRVSLKLPEGVWDIAFEMDGYELYKLEAIRISAGETVDRTEEIVLSAKAPELAEVALDDLPERGKLERFVGSWNGDLYENDNLDSYILFRVFMKPYITDLSVAPNLKEAENKDPLERFNEIPKGFEKDAFNTEAIMWIGKNVMNISDQDMERFLGELKDYKDAMSGAYEYDGYYYFCQSEGSAVTSQDTSSTATITCAKTDGEYYYITVARQYKETGDEGTNESVFFREFKLQLKTVDGVTFWSVYSCQVGEETPIPENNGQEESATGLTAYLEETLIPQYGLYDPAQTIYIRTPEWLKISYKYNKETGELEEERDYSVEGTHSENSVKREGIYYAEVSDTDGDGTEELLVIRSASTGSGQTIYMEKYKSENGAVGQASSMEVYTGDGRDVYLALTTIKDERCLELAVGGWYDTDGKEDFTLTSLKSFEKVLTWHYSSGAVSPTDYTITTYPDGNVQEGSFQMGDADYEFYNDPDRMVEMGLRGADYQRIYCWGGGAANDFQRKYIFEK